MESLVNPVIVGSSKGLRTALEVCRKAAREDGPVLFQGEVGTGKLLLATYLHQESTRADKPFIVVDCAEHTDFLSELLNKDTERATRLKFLEGGTIYCREAASLRLEQQARLHEVIQELEPLGIRVLLSSSQNIHLLMYDKAFDANLYQTFSQREVSIPPLRQRREDLPQLISYFLHTLNLRLRKSIQGLTPQVEEIFNSYRWPANVEEVQQVLTRAVLASTEPFIGQRHLMEYMGQMGDPLHSCDVMPLDRMEEILLRSALNRYGYTLEGKKRAARALNISLATLYNKVKRYNIVL